MPEPDRVTLLAQMIASELDQLSADQQRAHRYLFARIALDTGGFMLVNDMLPEGGMHLVLREQGTGRVLVAERPEEWTAEEEERQLAEMRARLLGKGNG